MTWKKDLTRIGTKPEVPNPYEKYNLLKNPFPGPGETRFEVCSDQENIKKTFFKVLSSFTSDSKRLYINGKHNAGKTNILRYFEKLTDEARRSKQINNLYPIYISDPGEDYLNIHGQIIDKLREYFLGNLITTLKSDSTQIDTLSEEEKTASEILEIIKAITQTNLFSTYEERKNDAFIRWLKGHKLLAADKKLLTHLGKQPIDITSSSLAIRFLYGLLVVLKKINLCDGIILLFDEFEEIFEGLTRSRQSQYAQDLRHCFDTLNEFVYFVVATVPDPIDLVQYPAIQRRLGNPIELQPIDSIELAIQYVSDYLENGRDNYEIERKKEILNRSNTTDLSPLELNDIEEEYKSLKEDMNKIGFDILPGMFLERMRERMKQKVENGN